MDDKSFNIRVPKKWARVAMIVTVTALIVAPLTAIASHSFTDVLDSNTFHADIEWLKNADVTKGCNPPANTLYCPSDNVTRGQMAAFMRRFAKYIDAEDGTPAQADNAAKLDGKNPVVYRNVLEVDAHSFLTDGTPSLALGGHELAAVAITIPAAGTVLVQGTTTFETLGNDSNVLTWIEMDTGTPCDSFFDTDKMPASLSEVWVDGDDTFGSGTTSSVAAVELGSAGTHTFYSCAQVQTNPIHLFDRTVTAQWTHSSDSNVTITGGGSSVAGAPADLGAGSE